MIRTIACSVVLALVCAAALAEDRKKAESDAAAAGAAQQEEARDTADTATAVDAAAQPAAARDAAAQDPAQMFVKDAYSSNLFEIQLSQLAAQRVQDDQIKQFARLMVQDHTKANQQLKQAAQSSQIQVPEKLDPVHQAKLQKMQQCPAGDLGRKYINSQVGGHWVNVLEFRYQAKNNPNPQLKQFASQTLPNLEKHLQHAQQIAEQQAGGEPRTASERLRGDASQPQNPGTSEPSGKTDQPADAAGRDAAGKQPE